MKIGWWPHTTDPNVASFRLRCLQVVRELAAAGQEASVYAPGAPAPEVLVLSKRYDPDTLAHARALAEGAGTSLVLDLCDNHFHFDTDPQGQLARRAGHLQDAIGAVDRVTTASQALAGIVRQACPDGPPISVIGDAAEAPWQPAWWTHLTAPRAWADLSRLGAWHRAQPQVPPARRFVWFGNHGSPGVDGGMADLALLRPRLEDSQRRSGPLSLAVISNHRGKYEQLTAGWSIPTHYLEWRANSFSPALRLQSAALIPVAPNPFTVCKTANRVLTAFQHGLNVIADAIPSYAEFGGCAVLDDWAHGLNEYTGLGERRKLDLAEGGRIARERYSLEAVGTQWMQALAATR